MVDRMEYPSELPPHIVDGHINALLGKAGVGGVVEFVRGGAAIVVRARNNSGEIAAAGMGQNVFEPLDIAAVYGRFDAIEGSEEEFRRGYTERANSQPEANDQPIDPALLSTLNSMVLKAADITVSRVEPDNRVQVAAIWDEIVPDGLRHRSEMVAADSFTTAFAEIVELR